MNYWWVNQNKTWKEEVGGGYLWSPKTKSNGEKVFHYENMKMVNKGDIIFSYYNQSIQSIGIVIDKAYEKNKPEEFGPSGSDWNTIGWKIDVHYIKISFPLNPKDFWIELKSVLPSKKSPINSNGIGYQ